MTRARGSEKRRVRDRILKDKGERIRDNLKDVMVIVDPGRRWS